MNPVFPKDLKEIANFLNDRNYTTRLQTFHLKIHLGTHTYLLEEDKDEKSKWYLEWGHKEGGYLTGSFEYIFTFLESQKNPKPPALWSTKELEDWLETYKTDSKESRQSVLETHKRVQEELMLRRNKDVSVLITIKVAACMKQGDLEAIQGGKLPLSLEHNPIYTDLNSTLKDSKCLRPSYVGMGQVVNIETYEPGKRDTL